MSFDDYRQHLEDVARDECDEDWSEVDPKDGRTLFLVAVRPGNHRPLPYLVKASSSLSAIARAHPGGAEGDARFMPVAITASPAGGGRLHTCWLCGRQVEVTFLEEDLDLCPGCGTELAEMQAEVLADLGLHQSSEGAEEE